MLISTGQQTDSVIHIFFFIIFHQKNLILHPTSTWLSLLRPLLFSSPCFPVGLWLNKGNQTHLALGTQQMPAEDLLNEPVNDSHHRPQTTDLGYPQCCYLIYSPPSPTKEKNPFSAPTDIQSYQFCIFPPTFPTSLIGSGTNWGCDDKYLLLLSSSSHYLKIITSSRKLSRSDHSDSCPPWLCLF